MPLYENANDSRTESTHMGFIKGAVITAVVVVITAYLLNKFTEGGIAALGK